MEKRTARPTDSMFESFFSMIAALNSAEDPDVQVSRRYRKLARSYARRILAFPPEMRQSIEILIGNIREKLPDRAAVLDRIMRIPKRRGRK